MSVAIVTGGAGGIGSACVRALAQEGHDVAVVDLQPAPEGAALGIVADATDHAAMEAAIEQARAELGLVEIAVGTVSHEHHAHALDLVRPDLDASMSRTAGAALALAQPVARRLVDAGLPGRIVLIGSLHATLPFPRVSAYNAAEGALLSLARSLAHDLVAHRIAVNVVEPGWIDTPGERRWYSDEQLRAAGERMPWGRLGTPDDVAAAVAFLAGPRAAYITGAALRVDGGLSLGMTDIDRGEQ